MDVPTEWRTCNLPGSRYQNEKPMNVSAMRVMRAHWPQMMAMLLRVRENYVRRFPEVADGWTVGHLERLSAAVLAVPTYQLMRQEGRVANGDLHPALSSLFRVTDGVRMVMHQMLFVPVGEPSRSPDHAVSIDEVLDYAERNYSFHATYGVCAGPKPMVRELVQVLLEGHGNGDYTSVVPEPALQVAMNDLDAAIDYGFLGLRVYAAAFSTWPVMTRAYERIAATLDAWPSIDSPAVAALRQSMRENGGPILSRTYLAQEDWRVSREEVYSDMYRQCGRALNPTFDEPALGVLLAPVWTDGHRATEAGLQDLLRRRFDLAGGVADGLVEDISGQIMEFLARIQAILRTGVAVQDEINRLLGRKQPMRALTAADINVYNLLQGDDPGRLPYLVDELERLLGIRIDVCKDRITVISSPPA
jgi:hypothetical protein